MGQSDSQTPGAFRFSLGFYHKADSRLGRRTSSCDTFIEYSYNEDDFVYPSTINKKSGFGNKGY